MSKIDVEAGRATPVAIDALLGAAIDAALRFASGYRLRMPRRRRAAFTTPFFLIASLVARPVPLVLTRGHPKFVGNRGCAASGLAAVAIAAAAFLLPAHRPSSCALTSSSTASGSSLSAAYATAAASSASAAASVPTCAALQLTQKGEIVIRESPLVC